MGLHEQIAFLKEIHPFENLTKSQIDQFVDNMDIIYFKKNITIQEKGKQPSFLYFIIKGVVQEKKDDEIISVYSKQEIFDPFSLIENYSKNSFVTLQETICYTLPKNIFTKILYENHFLESFFFQSISQKLNSAIIDNKNKELSNLMVAKVKDAPIHKAIIVPFETTIFNAVKTIKEENIPTLLLKDINNNIHIVTDSDFRQKVILKRMDFDDIVGKISSKNPIYIDENEFLFNAQLLMTKHKLKRLIVKNKKDEIVGIIDQISLNSFFATQGFSLSNDIDNAKNIEQLKRVSLSFTKIIKSLNAKGVKVDFISKLINRLNRKLLDKLFSLLAPNELINNSSLIVMGSEGRGEQILKTDQDNALILSNNCTISQKKLFDFTQNFTKTLVEFGFPRCEGNIMVSNPYWCQKEDDFKDLIYNWIINPKKDDYINLAIFYDAMVASGDKQILIRLKEYLLRVGSNSKTFYMFFAKVIVDFDIPLGFFDGFVFDSKDKNHKNEIDIKKGGIFIIVQSIRTLSLEHKLIRTNTLKRLSELEKIGVFDKEFASEIKEAFIFLLTLKLNSNLQKLDRNEQMDNYINPNNLNSIQKDLLKESFKIVNKLKKRLEHHYKLNYV